MSSLWSPVLICALSIAHLGGCSSRPDLARKVNDDGVRLAEAGWRFEKVGDWDVAFHLERSSELPRMVDLRMIVVDPNGDGAEYVSGYRFGDTFNHAQGVGTLDDADRPDISSAHEPKAIIEDAAASRRGDWLEVNGTVTADDADLLITTLEFRALRDGRPLDGRSIVEHTAVLDFGGRIAGWTVDPE